MSAVRFEDLALYLQLLCGSPPLDNRVLATVEAAEYSEIADFLAVPRRDEKDVQGTEVETPGYSINTWKFMVALPLKKQKKAVLLTSSTLTKTSISLYKARQFAGFLT